jgi:hypothetical protein
MPHQLLVSITLVISNNHYQLIVVISLVMLYNHLSFKNKHLRKLFFGINASLIRLKHFCPLFVMIKISIIKTMLYSSDYFNIGSSLYELFYVGMKHC